MEEETILKALTELENHDTRIDWIERQLAVQTQKLDVLEKYMHEQNAKQDARDKTINRLLTFITIINFFVPFLTLLVNKFVDITIFP